MPKIKSDFPLRNLLQQDQPPSALESGKNTLWVVSTSYPIQTLQMHSDGEDRKGCKGQEVHHKSTSI